MGLHGCRCTEKSHQRCRNKIADGSEQQGEGDNAHQRLGGHMIDRIQITAALVLGNQNCSGNSKANAQRDKEKQNGKAERHCSNRIRPQSADPKSVGKLVGRLQKIGEDNRNRQGQQSNARGMEPWIRLGVS